MQKFDELSESELSDLFNELDITNIDKVPTPGSRKWHLLEFTHWVIGEILMGNNPLPENRR